MAQIEQAISVISGFPLNSVEYGLQVLLERELAIARSLHGRMSDALAKIRLVVGLPPLVVDAVPTATVWDCEEESVRCADPDEIPAAEDEGCEGSSNGGSSDTGYVVVGVTQAHKRTAVSQKLQIAARPVLVMSYNR